jgi:hypothetical protein
MRGGNPLPRASRWHHYRGRHGNDRRDRLVTSHRSSMQASVKDSMVSSPAGLLTALNCVAPVSYDVPPIVCKSLEYCHLASLIRSSNIADIMNFIQASHQVLIPDWSSAVHITSAYKSATDASIVSVQENTLVTAHPFWHSGRRGIREKAPPLARRKE